MSDDEPIARYPFRLRDPLSGKWYRTRWKTSLADIESRGGIVDGPPEMYRQLGATSNFQVKNPSVVRDDRPVMHPQRESPPAIPVRASPDVRVPAPVRDLLCATQAICAGAGCSGAALGADASFVRYRLRVATRTRRAPQS